MVNVICHQRLAAQLPGQKMINVDLEEKAEIEAIENLIREVQVDQEAAEIEEIIGNNF